MQFTVDQLTDKYNVSAAVAESNNYPNIRVVTVTESWAHTPQTQFTVPPVSPWSVASSTTIGAGNWTATSAVCWFYGKKLYDVTGVPQGLVSSNWGGTTIKSWSDNATNAACNATEGYAAAPAAEGYTAHPTVANDPMRNHGYGVLFNAMIAPLAYGPMGVRTFIWYQGEEDYEFSINALNFPLYACIQPLMISSWRKYFDVPDAFFGFVELQPWASPFPVSPQLAVFRAAQLEALKLPNVGFAIATDIGDPTSPFGSIHPRNKPLIGARLAAAALTIVYNTPTNYLPPTLATSTAGSSGDGTALTVAVTFSNLPSTLIAAEDHCKTEAPYNVSATLCGFFEILTSDGLKLNATATIAADGKSLTLTAAASSPAGVTATGSSFGWNAWPINVITSAEGLPLQPWPFVQVSVND